MTHWRTKVSKDNPNLHFWDIEGKSPLDVEISAVEDGEVSDENGDIKGMMFIAFKGGKKKFGCNVTNATIIEQLHGKDIEGWVGKKVTLRTATCKGNECIRIDVPKGTRLGRNIPKFNYTDGE